MDKIYTTNMVKIDPKTGEISANTVIAVSPKKEIAVRRMRERYEEELSSLNLTDNDAHDENDESCPGGYFTEDEAGIYDYASFAFDQLLEIVSFTVCEQKVETTENDTPDFLSLEMRTTTDLAVTRTDDQLRELCPNLSVWVGDKYGSKSFARLDKIRAAIQKKYPHIPDEEIEVYYVHDNWGGSFVRHMMVRAAIPVEDFIQLRSTGKIGIFPGL